MTEFLRLWGELLVSVSSENAAQAENLFHQAVEMARSQKAWMLALRAALSMARLWRSQGRDEEARQLLDEFYGKMTEGFGLPDLEEARKLM